MYTDIYTASLPPELLAMAETPVMQRLLRVGMHCGCEYTAYPIYRDAVAPYSRYTHSLGTAAIVWHFTHDLKQSVAGLLHDIATPAFAHVVDFLNGDHMRQESTESRTRMMIASSPELMALLDKSGLTLDDVDDYHRYPIADNDSPRLSADRLEYTLGNAHLVFHCPKAELKRIFDDIFVGKNEENVDELCFAHADIADIFTQLSLRQSEWFVSDEDRFSMQALADLLREARQRNVLTVDDLYLDEPHVIALLLSDPVLAARWQDYRRIIGTRSGAQKPEGTYAVKIAAKKRSIDPLVQTCDGLDDIALAGAGKARAVEVHGKADAPAVASGLRLGVLLVLAAQVAGLVHLVHHGGQRDREVIFAGGRGSVALLDKVRFFEFKCIHAEVLGDVIHHHLHGEEGLRRAEAAISAAGCGVGLERPAMNMKVFNVVHAIGTDDAALQNDSRKRRIRTAVELHVDVHSRDLAVLDGHLVGTQGRVTLRCKFQILAAV